MLKENPMPNKPTTLRESTTIQTIKEAEEKLANLPNLALHDHFPKNMRGNEVDDVKEWANQTLLAVFESELESVPEDEDFKVQEDGEYHFGENQKTIGINQERARLRSHLTEVINYLKQK